MVPVARPALRTQQGRATIPRHPAGRFRGHLRPALHLRRAGSDDHLGPAAPQLHHHPQPEHRRVPGALRIEWRLHQTRRTAGTTEYDAPSLWHRRDHDRTIRSRFDRDHRQRRGRLVDPERPGLQRAQLPEQSGVALGVATGEHSVSGLAAEPRFGGDIEPPGHPRRHVGFLWHRGRQLLRPQDYLLAGDRLNLPVLLTTITLPHDDSFRPTSRLPYSIR